MLPSAVRWLAVVCLSLLLVVSTVYAQSGRQEGRGRSGPGTGNPDEHLVPWKFLNKGGELVKGPIVLYWLPASMEETRHSPLLTSERLRETTARCIGFEIVVPDDAMTIEKLGGGGKLPIALLVDNQGRVIRTAGNVHGLLSVAAVERMLTDELSSRDDAVYRELTEAKTRANMGEKEKSIELYKKIWDDRCLYPLIGNEAQRALKGLGVVVHDTPAPAPVDPNLKVTLPTSTGKRH